MEPEYIFLTAFSTNAFRNYVKTLNVDHCYEKPISSVLLDGLLARFTCDPAV